MRKPITAERRERGRRRALVLPLISAALGVAMLLGFALSGERHQSAGIWLGAVLIAFALLRFGVSYPYFRSQNYYGGPTPTLDINETVLWNERVGDPTARYGAGGGLTLTDERLSYVPTRDDANPDAKPREWAVDAIRSVSTENLRPVLYPGDWGGTLVFDVGEGNPQRFRVFDPAASAALIDTALSETRAQTQKGPTT